jgi:hypothetical protein
MGEAGPQAATNVNPKCGKEFRHFAAEKTLKNRV